MIDTVVGGRRRDRDRLFVSPPPPTPTPAPSASKHSSARYWLDGPIPRPERRREEHWNSINSNVLLFVVLRYKQLELHWQLELDWSAFSLSFFANALLTFSCPLFCSPFIPMCSYCQFFPYYHCGQFCRICQFCRRFCAESFDAKASHRPLRTDRSAEAGSGRGWPLGGWHTRMIRVATAW